MKPIIEFIGRDEPTGSWIFMSTYKTNSGAINQQALVMSCVASNYRIPGGIGGNLKKVNSNVPLAQNDLDRMDKAIAEFEARK